MSLHCPSSVTLKKSKPAIQFSQLFNNPSTFPNPPYITGILVVINMRLESTFQQAAFTTPTSSEIAFCSCLLMSLSLATQLCHYSYIVGLYNNKESLLQMGFQEMKSKQLVSLSLYHHYFIMNNMINTSKCASSANIIQTVNTYLYLYCCQ